MSAATIFMAGGGTGGHVFPLLAVARALEVLAPELELVFIGTDRGIESNVIPKAGFKLELMATLPFRGGGVAGASRGMLSVARALPRSRELLKQYAPRAVFSVGGYAAVPIALGARFSGAPLALMEPNATPGLANRLVGPFAKRVYTAFDETKKYFSARAVLRSGLAIRPGFEPKPYLWNGGGQPLRVLVLGGSQGARSLNLAVAPALGQVKFPLDITHQVGRGNLVLMRQRYAELRRPGASVIEFIENMPAAIAAADLVISRAGAGAIAEVSAMGRPSILVPLPHSGDHQLYNARAAEATGGAVCLPAAKASADGICLLVNELAKDPARLARMAESARAFGTPGAATRVAKDLLVLAGLREASDQSSSNGSPSNGAASMEQPVPVGGKDA
jgi:UDP-N-acetylglucosamine--N-acetylmuramyl-(pentapeptide) pyrophosphoryl-undecaprenol N-acetylglucosamine transferase